MMTIHEFIEAIKNEQYQTLLYRLKNENFSVEWNKKGPFNQNILHFAMKNAEVFKALCTHLKDNNEKQFIALLTEADSDGDTPLHQMIQFNRVDSLCILLDIGSKNTRVKEAIISALRTKNLKKDDVFALKDSVKQNILHFAMKNTAGFSMLCEELEKEPELFAQLIKAQDDEGDTPLHQMIQFNRVDALCILLDIGSKNPRVKEAIISALCTKNLQKDDVFALSSNTAGSKLIAEFMSHKKREEASPLRLIKEGIPVADKVQKNENAIFHALISNTKSDDKSSAKNLHEKDVLVSRNADVTNQLIGDGVSYVNGIYNERELIELLNNNALPITHVNKDGNTILHELIINAKYDVLAHIFSKENHLTTQFISLAPIKNNNNFTAFELTDSKFKQNILHLLAHREEKFTSLLTHFAKNTLLFSSLLVAKNDERATIIKKLVKNNNPVLLNSIIEIAVKSSNEKILEALIASFSKTFDFSSSVYGLNVLGLMADYPESFAWICDFFSKREPEKFSKLIEEKDFQNKTIVQRLFSKKNAKALTILLITSEGGEEIEKSLLNSIATQDISQYDMVSIFSSLDNPAFSKICSLVMKKKGFLLQLIKEQSLYTGNTLIHELLINGKRDEIVHLLTIVGDDEVLKQCLYDALKIKNKFEETPIELLQHVGNSTTLKSAYKDDIPTNVMDMLSSIKSNKLLISQQENWDPVKNKIENFLCQVLFLYKQSNNTQQLDAFSIERKNNSVFSLWVGNNLCLSTTAIGSIPFLYEVSQFLIDNGFKEQEDFMIEDSNVDYTNTYLAKYFRSTPKYSINFSANGTEKLCNRFRKEEDFIVLKEEENPYLTFYSEKSEEPPANENPYPHI